MFTSYDNSPRKALSGLAAIAVVALGMTVMDQAHMAAAPLGTVEVGEMTPVGLEKLAQATLPEIVITAEREAARGQRFASRMKTSRGVGVVVSSGVAP